MSAKDKNASYKAFYSTDFHRNLFIKLDKKDLKNYKIFNFFAEFSLDFINFCYIFLRFFLRFLCIFFIQFLVAHMPLRRTFITDYY